MNITSSGWKHLRAALGSTEFVKKYVKKKAAECCEEVICLTTIARRKPQAAYSAFIPGASHCWNYVQRTIPNITKLLTPLEEAIRHQLIPAITGQSTRSDTERDVLALPCRLGGLGIINPVLNAPIWMFWIDRSPTCEIDHEWQCFFPRHIGWNDPGEAKCEEA